LLFSIYQNRHSRESFHKQISTDGNVRSGRRSHTTCSHRQSFQRAEIRGALPHGNYQAQWFDPRAGTWRVAGNGIVQSGSTGILELPDFPDDADWSLRLEYAGPQSQAMD
jgi:hypothetical protein